MGCDIPYIDKKMTDKNTSTPKKIINITSTVIIVLVFAVILFCLITVTISKIKGEQANLFGYSFLHILTDSMEPEIPVGSSILVKKAVAEDIKVGDYVCYLAPDDVYEASGVLYITHECIEAIHTDPTSGKQVITTQGIKQGAPEETIEASRVQAVYISKMPSWLSTVFSFMLTPYGLATLICVPLLIALAIQLAEQIKSINRREKEKTDEELLQEEIEKQTAIITEQSKEFFKEEQSKIEAFLSKTNNRNTDNE